jgi:hypothetical protein
MRNAKKPPEIAAKDFEMFITKHPEFNRLGQAIYRRELRSHSIEHVERGIARGNLLFKFVSGPFGAAVLGVVVAGSMEQDLPGWECPAFAIMLAVTIVMFLTLSEGSNA